MRYIVASRWDWLYWLLDRRSVLEYFAANNYYMDSIGQRYRVKRSKTKANRTVGQACPHIR